MAGLFGLFGGKKKNDQADSRNKKDSFFLDSDEAKSLGKIDYMRSSQVKTQSTSVQPQTENKSQPQPESKPTRRVNDSSMDLFRQMAKDIKKQ